MVEPGRRCLGDRYELDRLIAAGGMGQVWRGLDILLQRPVAVKVLRSEYTGDATFLARFRAEAQHAASLSHPNIAAVFDYGEEIVQDGTGETLAYLVMELVEGEPLSTLVAREGPLATETTLSLLRQTAVGLGEAHSAGMVHRDVKPGNILVRADGSVKITDFGIAWSARSVALTRTGQVIGTPQYLSPEQAEGRPATPASDVYALGLIGYECLTGHPAFEGDNAVTIALKQLRQDPEPLPGDLPAAVRGLVRRALCKDPAARPPDGASFASAIDDVLAGRPPSETPATLALASAPVGRPSGRRASGPPGATRSPGPRRMPGGRGRLRLATVLLPLLALLAGAGIAAAVLQALSEGAPSSTASAAVQQDDGTVILDPLDYVGRPVGEVADELTALGLVVELREEVTADTVPDHVTDVRPAGSPLAAGETVTVGYAVAPPEEHGSSSTPAPAVSGAALPDQTAPTEVASEPATEPATESSTAPATVDLTEVTDTGSAEPSAELPASPTAADGTETSDVPEPTPSQPTASSAETTTVVDSSGSPTG